MHLSLRALHKGDGQTGHFGEFFVGLGAFIFLGGLAVILWGFSTTIPDVAAWWPSPFPSLGTTCSTAMSPSTGCSTRPNNDTCKTTSASSLLRRIGRGVAGW